MRNPGEQESAEKSRHAVIALSALSVFFVVWGLVFLLERALADPSPLHAWLQMLAGSTWPAGWGDADARATFPFALGVAWHFTLNVAPAIGVFWIFWALLEQRREHMQLRHLFRLRDESIKSRVADALRQRGDLSDEQRQGVEAAVDKA
jgi:hypothetical protein